MEINEYTHRAVRPDDIEAICNFPQDENELYFCFPRASFPLTIDQLNSSVENRSDSTVILSGKTVIGFANFYEAHKEQYCLIGNIIVNPLFRGKGVGRYLIGVMENIAITKYMVKETRISCFCTNINGLMLYHKLGYIPFELEERLDKKSIPIMLIKLKKKLI